MKLKYTIKPIIVISIIGVILAGAWDITGEVQNVSVYNCAENYDHFIMLTNEIKNMNAKQFQITDFDGRQIIGDLYENRCFITVQSWAFESDNEELIWDGNWEKIAWSNQLVLGEIEPLTKGDQRFILNYQISKIALEQTDNMQDYDKLVSKLTEEAK